jgi:hypothetical protein
MQRDKKFADARGVMKRIGAQLVRERKLVLSEGSSKGDVESAGESGKDLLSLLVKANMTDSEGISMSDEDVQDRESTESSHPKFISNDHLAHTLFISI